MEIPNFLKIFIGLIVIVFLITIFWFTSWRKYDQYIKTEQEEIMYMNNDIQHIIQQKEDIPKLNAQITVLCQEFLQIKTKTIADFNDAKKPLVKKQKKILNKKNNSKKNKG